MDAENANVATDVAATVTAATLATSFLINFIVFLLLEIEHGTHTMPLYNNIVIIA